jgi:hypothetical protein
MTTNHHTSQKFFIEKIKNLQKIKVGCAYKGIMSGVLEEGAPLKFFK